jgi:hypothetical protein
MAYLAVYGQEKKKICSIDSFHTIKWSLLLTVYSYTTYFDAFNLPVRYEELC